MFLMYIYDSRMRKILLSIKLAMTFRLPTVPHLNLFHMSLFILLMWCVCLMDVVLLQLFFSFMLLWLLVSRCYGKLTVYDGSCWTVKVHWPISSIVAKHIHLMSLCECECMCDSCNLWRCFKQPSKVFL